MDSGPRNVIVLLSVLSHSCIQLCGFLVNSAMQWLELVLYVLVLPLKEFHPPPRKPHISGCDTFC